MNPTGLPAPVVVPAESGAAKAPRATPRGLGRSALIVHGLALLFVAAAWAMMVFLGESTPESDAIQGVGGATGLVFAFWSAVLAVRALIKGEPARWPVLVIAVFLFEISVPCVAAWWPLLLRYQPNNEVFDWVCALGLPVFVPFFTLATALATPLAWWLTRRKERKELAAGKPAWERRRRWKRGMAWYGGIVGILAILVLPVAIYLFGILAHSSTHRILRGVPVLGVKWTPDVLKRFFYSLVADSPDESYWKSRLLYEGKLPKDLLEVQLYSDDSNLDWIVYFQNWPEEAYQRAMGIARDHDRWSSAVNRNAGRGFALIGRDCDTKHFLRSPLQRYGEFEAAVFDTILVMRPSTYVSDSLPLLDSQDKVLRRATAFLLANFLNELPDDYFYSGPDPFDPKRFADENWNSDPILKDLDIERIRAAAQNWLKEHKE